MQVANILSWLIILERNEKENTVFYCRLIGENAIQLLGKNYTGYGLDRILDSDTSADHWKDIRNVSDQRVPSLAETTVPFKGKEHNQIHRACFPFCDENKDIIRLAIIIEPI